MLSAEHLQMRLPIHISHQNDAQFKIWHIIYTDMAVVSSIQREVKKSSTHASGAPSVGKAFNWPWNFPSENAAGEALAYDKETLSLSLPNDKLILISCVCRPVLDQSVDKT